MKEEVMKKIIFDMSVDEYRDDNYRVYGDYILKSLLTQWREKSYPEEGVRPPIFILISGITPRRESHLHSTLRLKLKKMK